ncbi:MAG TPA: sulfatase-like hydrolase/transferase [Opitutus sp.]|nr:sulfatase-like hydrolase/transferase [Opitutus sp.]
MKRSIRLPALFLILFSFVSGAERTNIVFILADDLGWGDLGCYGNPQVHTPNLDGLARQGTRFTQFYVAAPVCSPSRAAFLTGEFPSREGIHGHFASIAQNAARKMPQFLDPTRPTLVSDLKRAGYATAHIGKWHLRNNVAQLYGGEPPDDRGQGPTPAAYGFDYVGSGEPYGANGPPDDPYYRARSSRVFVDEALGFIKQHRDGPFYVELWALLPHARLNPRPDQLEPYAKLRPGPDFPHHGAAEIYLSSVTDLDTQLGRLFAGLQELGLADNTLVVFTSDNGPEDIHVGNAGHSGIGSTGPFRGRKRSLYEGGIRLPLIVRWPGRVPAGRIDRRAVLSSVDFRPTFDRVAGIEPAPGREADGEDVADIWQGGYHARRRPLFWEWRFSIVGDPVNHSPRLAVRDGEWKLLLNPDRSRVELYRPAEDPTELNNLAREHPHIVDRLAAKAIAWSQTLPAGPSDPGAGKMPTTWSEMIPETVPDP